MAWTFIESIGQNGQPSARLFRTGLVVAEGDLIIPAEFNVGTNTGTPGDGTALSAYHVTTAGVLGSAPASNYPATAEGNTCTSGTATLLAKNLYVLDYSAGGGGTGSQATPFNTDTGPSGSNGRVVIGRIGQTGTGTAGWGLSGNPTNKTYGWALTYAQPGDTGQPQVGTFAVSNARWVVVDNYKAVGTGTTNGFTYTQGSGVSCDKVYFRNCYAFGVTGDPANCDGFAIFGTVATSLPITSLYFDRCTATNCGGYGFGLEGCFTDLDATNTVNFYKCTALGNGADKTAWGFGGYAPHSGDSSGTGWARVGGAGTFIYSRAETTLPVRLAEHGGGRYRHLTKTTGTQTAPGTNEWGWAANVLYVNLGVDNGTTLSGRATTWSYKYMDGATFTRCTATSTVAAGDGTGFGADTLTKNWTFTSCLSTYNEGGGFVSNIALSANFRACIATDNGSVTSEPNFNCNNGDITIYNCSSFRAYGSGLGGNNPNGTLVLKNSIIKDNARYGIEVAGTVSESKNAFWNNTLGHIQGGTPAGTSLTIPINMRSIYAPTNLSLLAGGENLGGVDFYGTSFTTSPSLGAVQFVPTSVFTFGYGGLGRGYGSFEGRAPPVDRPATGTLTDYRYGFGGRRFGSFAGKQSFFNPSRTGGPFTIQNPYGFGGKRYGSFAGRITVDPGGTGSGSFALSGTNSGKLVVGDAGGPTLELGYFSLTGSGVAITQIGGFISTGAGSFSLSGTAEAFAVASGTVAATGSGNLSLTGTGAAYGPTITATGSGNISLLEGGGVAVLRYPGPGEFTLQDIVNATGNRYLEPGVTADDALRAIAAILAGRTNGGTGNTIFGAIGNPQTTRVQGVTTETGARDNIILP